MVLAICIASLKEPMFQSSCLCFCWVFWWWWCVFFSFCFCFVFLFFLTHLQEFWVLAMFLILFTNILPFAVAFLIYHFSNRKLGISPIYKTGEKKRQSRSRSTALVYLGIYNKMPWAGKWKNYGKVFCAALVAEKSMINVPAVWMSAEGLFLAGVSSIYPDVMQQRVVISVGTFVVFWTVSWYLAQALIELAILLPLTPRCWDYIPVPPQTVPYTSFLKIPIHSLEWSSDHLILPKGSSSYDHDEC